MPTFEEVDVVEPDVPESSSQHSNIKQPRRRSERLSQTGASRGLTRADKRRLLNDIDGVRGFDKVSLESLLSTDPVFYCSDKHRKVQFRNLYNYWKALDSSGRLESIRANLTDKKVNFSRPAASLPSYQEQAAASPRPQSVTKTPRSNTVKMDPETAALFRQLGAFDDDEDDGK